MIFTNLIEANLKTTIIGRHIEYYTYLDSTNSDGKIFCIDPNKSMIEKGKNKLKN